MKIRVYQRNGLWGVDFTWTNPATGSKKRCRKLLHKLKTVVQAQADQISAAVVKGTFIEEFGGIFEIAGAKTITLREGMEWYLEDYAAVTLKKKGYDQVKYVLGQFCDILENKPAGQVRIADLTKYKKARLKSVSMSSINRELGLISGFFTRMTKNEIIAENPVKGKFELYQVDTKRDRVIGDDELKKILGAIQNPEVKMIIFTARYTGMRLSNVCGLDMSNINFARGIIVFKQVKPYKGKHKINVIPMAPELMKNLLKYIEHQGISSGPLFTLSSGKISNIWHNMALALGIENAQERDLRRTFSSHLGNIGANPKDLQELLGHENVDMTMNVYTVTTVDRKRLIVDQMEGDWDLDFAK